MKQLADLNHRLTTRAAISALVLIGLGFFSVQLLSDWKATDWSASRPAASQAQSRHSSHVDVAQLASAHLFGTATASTKTTAKPVTRAPETRLKLELQGAFSSSVVEDGRALIAERGKSANYYRVGDSLPGGATLHRVAAEHVVLSRAGRLETLSFASLKNKPSKIRTDFAVGNGGRSAADEGISKDVNTQQTASIKERLKRLREAQTRAEL